MSTTASQPPPRKPLLVLKNLERRFISGEQEIAVLRAIDLTIHAGEMVAIVGASGSGKSTLMNILGCLDQPSGGEYWIDGRETRSLDSDTLAALRRGHFGFIFQRYHLLPHLDALKNVEIPAVYSGLGGVERDTRARELLDRLGLSDRTGHKPNQLSGGQQQRVSIARALMNGGDVILADEPTGALDSASGEEVMRILRELHERGHTVILVTHDMKVANNAERIIELCDGEIVADRLNPDTPPRNFLPPRVAAAESAAAGALRAGLARFAEAFNMAWIALTSHRMRTLLTMLGIIIGITSVVSVVALGQGARQKIISDIRSIGTNTIAIYPGRDWGDDKAATIHTLVPGDLDALSRQVYTDSVSPSVNGSLVLRYRNIKANASIAGVNPQYFRVRGLKIADGIIFSDDDVRRQTQVVVIDHNTRNKLFAKYEHPVGQVIFLGNLPCTVIGVTEENESPFGNNQNLNVWIPYTAAMSRLFGQTHFNSITARVYEGMSNAIAQQNIIKLLTARHGEKDFFTSSSDSILQTVQKTTATLALLISAIAVISLVVGGIGVMNIMLVSVTERTHEIGIRMAVGARQSDIMQQFLIESVMVCLLGGFIGIVLSFVAGAVFSVFVQMIAMQFSMLSIVSAVACSSLIGIAFGFLPARRAARLDPIEALARE